MENQVSLDSAKYDELLRCLFILKDNCNDVDIREGFIRQRSNDNSTIFELDLSSIISNISLPINELKIKLDIFKCFSGQEVTIKTTDDSFYISDQYSMLKIKNPILDYMDNKFMTAEELGRLINTNQEDLLISTDISKTISDRMRIISGSFHVNSLQILFENELASICASTQSKDNFAKFIQNIVSNRELNHISSVVITPFIIDHDGDIKFEMYDAGSSLVMNTFSTSIGSINANLYARSKMMEIE